MANIDDYKTATCTHCGADYQLHQFDTNKCPDSRYKENGKWRETVFEDSGTKQLYLAAPELLAAAMDIENDDNSIPAPIWQKLQDAIKKATL